MKSLKIAAKKSGYVSQCVTSGVTGTWHLLVPKNDDCPTVGENDIRAVYGAPYPCKDGDPTVSQN
jgi:hypothetical protein